MYYDDHAPPHFHAYYGKNEAIIELESLLLNEGSMPRRAMNLITEWASIHRQELFENWNLAELHQPLLPIDPLE